MFSTLVVYQWGVWENTGKFLQVLWNMREIFSLNLCFCSFSVGIDGGTSLPLRASVPNTKLHSTLNIRNIWQVQEVLQ